MTGRRHENEWRGSGAGEVVKGISETENDSFVESLTAYLVQPSSIAITLVNTPKNRERITLINKWYVRVKEGEREGRGMSESKQESQAQPVP